MKEILICTLSACMQTVIRFSIEKWETKFTFLNQSF